MVRISTALLTAIRAQAAADPEREVCGLLFGSAQAIDAAEPCANIAAAPRCRFEIDPVRLIAAYRAERAGGARLIGSYHSHPSGVPVPSATDAAQAAPDGKLWLIVSADAARLWRAVPDGAVHRRFDPVLLRSVAGAGCVGAGAGPKAPASRSGEDVQRP